MTNPPSQSEVLQIRQALEFTLHKLLDDSHTQVALEFWDLLYARQQPLAVEHFLDTVGRMIGISQDDRHSATREVRHALDQVHH
jgi:hypothetical protein